MNIVIGSRVCSRLGYYRVIEKPYMRLGQLFCKVQADCEDTIKVYDDEIISMPLDSLVLVD